MPHRQNAVRVRPQAAPEHLSVSVGDGHRAEASRALLRQATALARQETGDDDRGGESTVPVSVCQVDAVAACEGLLPRLRVADGAREEAGVGRGYFGVVWGVRRVDWEPGGVCIVSGGHDEAWPGSMSVLDQKFVWIGQGNWIGQAE